MSVPCPICMEVRINIERIQLYNNFIRKEQIKDLLLWIDGYYQKENILVAELIRHLKVELQKGDLIEEKQK